MAKTKAKKVEYDLGLYVETEALAGTLRGLMGIDSGRATLDSVRKELTRPLAELKKVMKHFEFVDTDTVADLVEVIETRSSEVRKQSKQSYGRRATKKG